MDYRPEKADSNEAEKKDVETLEVDYPLKKTTATDLSLSMQKRSDIPQEASMDAKAITIPAGQPKFPIDNIANMPPTPIDIRAVEDLVVQMTEDDRFWSCQGGLVSRERWATTQQLLDTVRQTFGSQLADQAYLVEWFNDIGVHPGLLCLGEDGRGGHY